MSCADFINMQVPNYYFCIYTFLFLKLCHIWISLFFDGHGMSLSSI